MARSSGNPRFSGQTKRFRTPSEQNKALKNRSFGSSSGTAKAAQNVEPSTGTGKTRRRPRQDVFRRAGMGM